MNLLVFNIRTDADHPTQGVTTRWLNVLSDHFDHIDVITIHRGRLELRKNIRVHSLGGESGFSKFKKVIRFYRLLFMILARRKIHGCFTHMAVLLTLLGGPILVFKGVRRVTWYAHSIINPVMLGGFLLSNHIVTASPDSYRIRSPKVHVTGHGIDVEHYAPRERAAFPVFLIGSIGRISKIKDYETLIRAASLLRDENVQDFEIRLYGNIQTKEDNAYAGELKALVRELGLESKVLFPGPLTGDQVPEIAANFSIFVNMLSKGGAGKAVLESMSMQIPTLICTPAFDPYLTDEDRSVLVFRPQDPENLKEKIVNLMLMKEEKRQQIGERLREFVCREHSLTTLGEKISRLIKDPW